MRSLWWFALANSESCLQYAICSIAIAGESCKRKDLVSVRTLWRGGSYSLEDHSKDGAGREPGGSITEGGYHHCPLEHPE